MKKFLLGLLLSSCVISNAQVGIGTITPSAASMLEVSGGQLGNYKGFMPPRVNTLSNRNAIPATSEDSGLLVFVMATGCLDIWNGTTWENVHCTGNVVRVWINELHYDNDGADVGEFIEIAGLAETDLSGYTIALYNQAGTVYTTIALSGSISDQSTTGYGTLSFFQMNIQNGADDGLALINPDGVVLQLLSYEGTFTATTGPALGMTSIDMGVEEVDPTGPGGTPAGESIQLIGTGNTYVDFIWSGPSLASPGTINIGQTF